MPWLQPGNSESDPDGRRLDQWFQLPDLLLTCLFKDSKSGRGGSSFPISGILELMALKVADSMRIWPPKGTSLRAFDSRATCGIPHLAVR